jgi:ATP-binding cassette subfamily F protein uup
MPAINAQHIRKSFGPQVVLDDATFTLARGEKVGLIGANGAGKSTFARILAGQELPDAGTVSLRRGTSVRYLAQEPQLDPNASARSAVEDALTAWRAATQRHGAVTAELAAADGAARRTALVSEQAELDDAIRRLGGWDREHEALGFLHKLGVADVDGPCGVRSGGERRRIALAQLLVASPDVAILDEPTNHLDADSASWLEEFLARDFRGAILLVTHDRYFLDAVVQRVVELERGKLVTFAGGYSDYLEKKAELLAQDERVEQNRQNALRREREWLSRGPKARGTKQRARIQRAAELESRGPATGGRPGEVALLTAAAPRQGKTILELRGLQLSVTADRAPLHEPIDLIVTAGERVGIVGPNGAGKTTLIRGILAAVEHDRFGEARSAAPFTSAGQIVVGKNTKVAYLDQARSELDGGRSIFDDVRGDNGSTVVRLGVAGRESMDLRTYLELFLFDAHKQRQKVSSLSGGERARVALAKVLREGANLLLFDEPTNDLDLPTLSVLEEMLGAYDGSVLVVTHDRAFLDRVATSILAFERNARAGEPSSVTRYAGGYQDYVAQRAARPAPARESRAQAVEEGAGPATRRKPKGGLTYAERIELDEILGLIDAAERELAEIEALLAAPSLYAKRGNEVAGLQERAAGARGRTAALVSRWEELEAKKEGPAPGSR